MALGLLDLAMTTGKTMRIKLPENFGGISRDGSPIELEPDADGCVEAGADIAQDLLIHGGTIAPAVDEENARVDESLEAHDRQRDLLSLKRQKGK